MKPFRFLEPQSLSGAVAMLAEHADDGARLIAGGQTLLLAMKDRTATPSILVSVAQLPELQGTAADDSGLRIGAGTTYTEMAGTSLDGWHAEIGRVAGDLADRPVRNMGTLGGALCAGDPRYDMPALMAGVDAQVTVMSLASSRSLAVGDLLACADARLRPEEILTEIRVPPVSRFTAVAFEKFRHRVFDAALASVTCAIRVDDDGVIAEARMALGAIATTPVVVSDATTLLVGRPPGAVDFDAAVASVTAEMAAAPRVMSGRQRNYQDELVPSLVRRALGRVSSQRRTVVVSGR